MCLNQGFFQFLVRILSFDLKTLLHQLNEELKTRSDSRLHAQTDVVFMLKRSAAFHFGDLILGSIDVVCGFMKTRRTTIMKKGPPDMTFVPAFRPEPRHLGPCSAVSLQHRLYSEDLVPDLVLFVWKSPNLEELKSHVSNILLFGSSPWTNKSSVPDLVLPVGWGRLVSWHEPASHFKNSDSLWHQKTVGVLSQLSLSTPAY